MKYEFILKQKLGSSCGYEQLGINVVKDVDFDNQLVSFQKYIASRKKRYPNADYLILINKLDDEGNFIEVIQ